MSVPAYELHNDLAGKVVASIVKPVIDNGGTNTEILVVLESVIVGVLMVVSRLGSSEIVFDRLVDGVKKRLAGQRIKGN